MVGEGLQGGGKGGDGERRGGGRGVVLEAMLEEGLGGGATQKDVWVFQSQTICLNGLIGFF